MTTREDRIKDAEERTLADIRTQKRNIRYEFTTPSRLNAFIESQLDVSLNIVRSTEAQPALGSFDAATLEKIQRTFKRYTFS